MKQIILLCAVLLLLTGCVFDAPLEADHKIKIDESVLGLWKPIPKSGKEPKKENLMNILRFSDTEYLVHYPTNENGIYYRAYPIELYGVKCIQIEVIGTAEGPIENKDRENMFHVSAYTLEKGILKARMLNTDVIDDDLKGTRALRKAFKQNKNHENLFKDLGPFQRAEKR